jgi:hypothetical protein
MAFKLKFQGKSKELYGSDNSMVRKGLVTPTYLMEGPGDKKPVKTKKELEQEANLKAQNAPKVELKPGDPGYDSSKKASYVQKGLSEDQLQWLKDNPDYFKNNPDVKPKSASEVGKAEIFSYEDKDKEIVPDDTPEITYTTTENPRKVKAQDYIVGQGDKVFAPPSTQRMMGLSKALTGLTGKSRADLFGFRPMNEKEVQPYRDAHDKKVLDSRAVKGELGKNTLTIQEQLDFQKAHGGLNPNQLGGGDSRIVDTKSGKGQTTKNQNIVKDAQGNMILQTFNKRGKVIATEPLSPENDIRKNKMVEEPAVNASTASGGSAVVETQSFVNRKRNNG